MQGVYWYGGLVVLSFFLLGTALHRNRDWRLVVLQLAITGIIHPFEVTILHFDAYRFMPGILPQGADNFLGAYVSDWFIIPASAVIISAFSLSWSARIVCAAVFTFVDWYFTQLGIYEHYWWRSIYTGFGLIPLYAVSDWLWAGLQSEHPRRLFRLLVIYLVYAPIHGFIQFVANRTDQLFVLQVTSWHFADPMKISAILVNITTVTVATVAALFLGLKMPFRYRFIGVGIIVTLYWGLGHFGIFIPQAKITSLHLVLVPLIAVFLLTALFRAARLDYLFP